MTENEAINELQTNIDLPFGFTVSDEVSKIAIKALEEIQQYRAIGTIGEIKDMLGEHEEQYREIRAKAIEEFVTELLLKSEGCIDMYVWCSDIEIIAHKLKMKGCEEYE